MTERTRLAHLSDVHLLSLSGTRAIDFVNKRWLGGVDLLAQRRVLYDSALFDSMVDDLNQVAPDHVLATGDITNLALPSEFEFARGRFDRLSGGPTGVTVIPGNHDCYVAHGAPGFDRHFAPFFTSDTDWALEGDAWPCVRVRGQVAVVALSTAVPSPWFFCYGRLGETQLERLERVLTDPRLAGKLRVVALHHPPVGKASASPRRGLRDRGEFAEVIARAGAELVLHGHEHLDLVFDLPSPDGPVPVRGITSGIYVGKNRRRRAAYRIYEIAAEGAARPRVVREEVRAWNKDARQFMALEPGESLR